MVASPGGEQETQAAEPVRLKARQRKVKSPFATQLHAGTLARLEWIKAHGYVITDTVDEAINRYLTTPAFQNRTATTACPEGGARRPKGLTQSCLDSLVDAPVIR